MNTVATNPPPPYHHHPPPRTEPISIHTQKSILDLLNSKFTPPSQIHSIVLKTGHFHDHYVSGTLLKSYTNHHSLDHALQIFRYVQSPNVFVYNVLIKACLDGDKPQTAMSLFRQLMVNNAKPNEYTYTPLFKACADCSEGMQIHGHVVKLGLCRDDHIRSSAIRMYGRFGNVIDARKLLDEGCDECDVVCWNAVIDVCFKAGEVEAARKVFDEMPEKNIGSWNAVISGLAKCGKVEEARKLFDEMEERDEITWSGLIDGYIDGGFYKEALEVFNLMQREGIQLTRFALTSVLSACAHLGALDQGRWIHAYLKKKRKGKSFMDPTMATALLDMYAKCGRLDMAWEVFESLKKKEVFTWNAMIGGMAIHGRGDDAVELFAEMQRKKFKPDKITFVGVLNACAHSGDVDRAMEIFDSMEPVYGVVPGVEHYGCLVHGLARAGRLEEAEELVDSMSMMSMPPNAAVYGALLGGCRIHGNVDLGERVGKILLELDPYNSGRYALLSNIYAKAER
ncbi:Pentatricopeptide repeat-containing protein At4g18840 [Linum grandiflorum]